MLASGVISSVLPSGGAAFTQIAATMPTAPGLFSTTTVRPSDRRILSAIRRVRVSLLAPGGKPSTSFNGSSACAVATPAMATVPASAARRLSLFIVPPKQKLGSTREIVTRREIDFAGGPPHFPTMADTTDFA